MSWHQIEAECRRGAQARRIGSLREDCLGYALRPQDPASLFALGCDLARCLKRNGVLHSEWARGWIVAAVDGTEMGSSFVRCCEACRERKVQRQVGEDLPVYPRLCALTIVSTPFPIPWGIRFQKKGESEVACTLALFEDLIDRLGRRFFDLLVADALYLQKPFVEAVEAWGLAWVMNLKEDQPELLAEAQRATAGPARFRQADRQPELELGHAPEVYGAAADRSIRIVKTVRILKKNRQGVSRAQAEKKHLREQSTNFYASNFVLGSISPLFLHQ